LLDCLSRLEYRGYDSCGVAIRDRDIKVYKDITRVADLIEHSPELSGTMGIGHTRWATHGIPSVVNAHPHMDCSGKFAVVHNGVISNYAALKQQLIAEGHIFLSETDTEVIPHLVEKYYDGNLENAVAAAIAQMEGTYAVIVMCEQESKLVVARKDSPLVIGIGDGERFIASDVPAFIHYTNKAIYLENETVAVITADSVTITENGKVIKCEEQRVDWCREKGNKNEYAHFMLKEIHEQPEVVANTLGPNVLLDLDTSLDSTAKAYSSSSLLPYANQWIPQRSCHVFHYGIGTLGLFYIHQCKKPYPENGNSDRFGSFNPFNRCFSGLSRSPLAQ
jgi:glucosamine--fructose-6-phosphate aminotransferase (isomerizing)